MFARSCIVFATAGLVVLGSIPCSAHFIWIFNNGRETRAVFGEGSEPGQAEFLSRIESMRVWEWDGRAYQSILFDRQTNEDLGWYVCRTQYGRSAKEAECLYGVFRRGDSAMLLNYGAKYLSLADAFPTKSSGNLTLDLIPRQTDAGVQLQVLFKGQPFANCSIQCWTEGSDAVEMTSDESGRLNLPAITSQLLLMIARVNESEAGVHNGENYDERSYYCTLVVENSSVTSSTANETAFADLPLGVTSFGAAIAQGKLYVFGGHLGDAHQYSSAGQNDALLALDLDNPAKWHVVNRDLGVQGLALVSHADRLYRLGGFAARNAEGESQDLHSIDQFAVYEPTSEHWRPLPSLPEPRSSFDACVVGNRLYVVGGWTLAGSEAAKWLETAWTFDLSDLDGNWEPMAAPPFKRRALALAAVGNRIYAIGGMESTGISRRVDCYDIERGEWAAGPELPAGSSMEGFGSAACGIEGALYVSTYDGNLYQLSPSADRWSRIAELDSARFFHRMLPIDSQNLVLIGGANMEAGKLLEVEQIPVAAKSKTPAAPAKN